MLASIGTSVMAEDERAYSPYGNLGWNYFFSGSSASYISSSYGSRGGTHVGFDIISDYEQIGGTTICSVYSGSVAQVYLNPGKYNYNWEVGFALSIAMNSYDPYDNSRLYTMYMHMRDLPLVGNGSAIYPGQPLGYVGTTGDSTGNHLHFQVNRGEVFAHSLTKTVDPQLFFPSVKFTGYPNAYDIAQDDLSPTLIPIELANYLGADNIISWLNTESKVNSDFVYSINALRKNFNINDSQFRMLVQELGIEDEYDVEAIIQERSIK